MFLQELLATNKDDDRVKLLVITPDFMGAEIVMGRITDEFGVGVIAASDKDGEVIESVLAVLSDDAKAVIELINKGTFDTKYEQPRAKLAPHGYYNADLDFAFEYLSEIAEHLKKK